jgi:hypothetical protein
LDRPFNSVRAVQLGRSCHPPHVCRDLFADPATTAGQVAELLQAIHFDPAIRAVFSNAGAGDVDDVFGFIEFIESEYSAGVSEIDLPVDEIGLAGAVGP